jgi:hypothetical protein
LNVARVAAVLPGYASVARAAEALHLAARSVRDLIYSGRLPSLRVGRLHYVRSADLELERRRRLGLRLPKRQRTPRRARAVAARPPRAERAHVDPELRRRRATERAAEVQRWAQRHQLGGPSVPFGPVTISEAATCAVCGRALRVNQPALQAVETGEPLCLACGRRALLDWADRRRLEAAAARRMAQDLGAATPSHQSPRAA